MTEQQSYVLRAIEERRVRLVRLWFTDVLGQLKSIAISPVELESAFEEGIQFDGSAIDGFSRTQESDVLAMPDASSFQLMSWGESGDITARIFCDLQNLDGTPFEGDPRQVLRRNVGTARAAGFDMMCAPEVEFFYLDSDLSNGPIALDDASYFDLTTYDASSDIRRATIHRLEATGIPIEYAFHEDAPSQHEIDLQYDDALSMADNLVTLRLVVREVALQHGVHATFMPKPVTGQQGSGMHTHLSMFRDGANAFHDPDDPTGLSTTGQHFMAGLLHHAAEITAVTNQLVNSYKRLVSGFEAPSAIYWARNNRSALVRVPVPKRGKEAEATRVEYRSLDPACNPYLAFSLILAAGMAGINGNYDLADEAAADAEQSAPRLPSSLSSALDVMESSELVRGALGEHIFEWFLRNKRAEWTSYESHVSQFELDRYLKSW